MAKRNADNVMAFLTDWDEPRARRVLFALFAVLIGLLAGMLLFSIASQVLMYLFPQSPLADIQNRRDTSDLMIELLSVAAAALLTGYVSVRVAKQGLFPAIIGAGAMAIWTVISFVGGGQPVWMALVTLVLSAGCAVGAGWMGDQVNVRRGLSSRPSLGPRTLDDTVTAPAYDGPFEAPQPVHYEPEPAQVIPPYLPGTEAE